MWQILRQMESSREKKGREFYLTQPAKNPGHQPPKEAPRERAGIWGQNCCFANGLSGRASRPLLCQRRSFLLAFGSIHRPAENFVCAPVRQIYLTRWVQNRSLAYHAQGLSHEHERPSCSILSSEDLQSTLQWEAKSRSHHFAARTIAPKGLVTRQSAGQSPGGISPRD